MGEYLIMKIIAFYLPQYHRVKENDEWWGEGFTEWTNVKKARPVFKGQVQPKIPLNENYYDLLDKKTVEWQTELMHKYGISGFCYYHYWFNGRKLLEKPAENLLEWKEINQPFCFSWANNTWARTWSAVRCTNWVVSDKKSGPDVLIEQTYGEEKDWAEHYNYLREFFFDSRYIKKDNKPVFLIYRLGDIDCAEAMLKKWQELAKEDGFNGIYIVSMNQHPNVPYVDAVAMYGNYGKYARNTFKGYYNRLVNRLKLPFKNFLPVYNYKTVWRGMVKEKPIEGFTTYPGAVVMYDETPRRGEQATYLKKASPKVFKKYLGLQIEKAEKVCHSDMIFLDAWNEWGEGNYLEPDVENGYAYLEAVRECVNKIDEGSV